MWWGAGGAVWVNRRLHAGAGRIGSRCRENRQQVTCRYSGGSDMSALTGQASTIASVQVPRTSTKSMAKIGRL